MNKKICMILLFYLSTNYWSIHKNYLESFVWTSNYYFNDCLSWKWFYKYHFAPSIKDLNNYLKNINDVDVESKSKQFLCYIRNCNRDHRKAIASYFQHNNLWNNNKKDIE